MAKFCKDKTVLITVYVEKPRGRRVSSNQHHPHRHYLHHTNNQGAIHYKNSGCGKGYNRRAELLRYSQSLRKSAQPAASASASSSTLLLPKPTSPKNQQPTTQSVAVHRKPKHARTPTCLGSWKISIPSFIRSLISPKAKKDRKKKKRSGSTSTAHKMKALVRSLEKQKKRRFIPKLYFSTLRKHR